MILFCMTKLILAYLQVSNTCCRSSLFEIKKLNYPKKKKKKLRSYYIFCPNNSNILTLFSNWIDVIFTVIALNISEFGSITSFCEYIFGLCSCIQLC